MKHATICLWFVARTLPSGHSFVFGGNILTDVPSLNVVIRLVALNKSGEFGYCVPGCTHGAGRLHSLPAGIAGSPLLVLGVGLSYCIEGHKQRS